MGTINLNLNSSLASSIQSTANLIGSVVNGFIVSPNGAPPGVSGFVFHIIDDEEFIVDSDTTDHFVEQNYAIQDHVALKPIRFTLKGFEGELINIIGAGTNPIINTILALAPLTDIVPVFNVQDGQVYSDIAESNAQSASVISNLQSLFSLISDLGTVQTNQQAACNFFLNMRNNRQLVTIQTPYGLLTNYIIESFRALQPGDSRFMSRFTVTFKQIQVVSTAVAPTAQSPNPDGTGVQTSSDSTQTPPAPSPGTTLPPQPQISSDTTNNTPNDYNSGRITDMVSPTVLSGQTSGLTAEPDTNPAVPVTTGNIFPSNNPIFQTLPLQPLTPSLVP